MITYFLIDVENLCGWGKPSENELCALDTLISALAKSIGGDCVCIAATAHISGEAVLRNWGRQETGAEGRRNIFLTRSGKDGADLALLDWAAQNKNLLKEAGHVVVGSGDEIFSRLVGNLSLWTKVILLTRSRSESTSFELANAANKMHLVMDELVPDYRISRGPITRNDVAKWFPSIGYKVREILHRCDLEFQALRESREAELLRRDTLLGEALERARAQRKDLGV